MVLAISAVASSSSSGVLVNHLGLVRMSAIIASRLAKPAFFATSLHLGADPRDLAQAELVDFLGRQVGRRLLPDLEGIIFLALRHRRDADALAALALEIAVVEVGEGLVGRVDLGRESRVRRPRLQRRPFGLRDTVAGRWPANGA